jgi:hypothetical protein
MNFVYCDYCHSPVVVAVDPSKGKYYVVKVNCQKCAATLTVEIKLTLSIIESRQVQP